MEHSNPNGACFDKDGIPQRGTGLFMGNYPIKDREPNT
jgi:hypothetical protein